MSKKVFVGIDVSKGTLDVHVCPGGTSCAFENSAEGVKALAKELAGCKVAQVIVEATGGLERRVAAHLVDAGFEVVVVNPRQVRRYAQARGILAKTDKVDAQVLAQFGRDIRPKVRPLRTDDQEAVRTLVARREQLMKMRVAEINRLNRTDNPKVVSSITVVLEVLNSQIAAVDSDLDEKIKASPVWRVTDDLMQSVVGVGQKTSMGLLASMPEIGSLTNKEAGSLAGLAPFAKDSGKMRGRRMIQAGRPGVRRALYMATLVAIQHNPDIKKFNKRLRAAGKPGKVAVTACMRKLLITLNAVVARGTKWTPKNA
ncbi:MAG: IS110 family transposase [candidate division Zixibacteria bacterium]|nr:IS110 family transposase [candidate division Zixibacteria bacterium]